MKKFAVAVALAGMAHSTPAAADLTFSGLVDFVARNDEADVTNINFRPTSNLDAARTRLFVDSNVSEDVQFFGQFLLSDYSDFFIYAAYLRFEELGGSPVSLHAGLIPNTVGNWGPRTYSDRNPLVGVPLLWNHHSSLTAREAQGSIDELLAARDTRNSAGLPVLYDNCWNGGAELWGQAGAFDWSVALLNGSTTLPQRENGKALPQVTSRLAWNHGPGLVLGGSGWVGPYLVDGMAALQDRKETDFLNAGGGVDLSWTRRHLEVNSEVMYTSWEHPTLPRLGATSGYVEAKHKVRTRWFVASRVGFFEPTRVTDGAGQSVHWDYRVRRYENGVGFRWAPRVTVKGVVQNNRFLGGDALNTDHYLVQLSAGF